MIVSVTNFNDFINNYESSTSVVSLKESIILSAEDVVKDYLGYDPNSMERVEYHRGTDKKSLFPSSKNITEIDSITEDGVEIDDYSVREDYIFRNNGFSSEKEYCVTYTSGFTSSQMPTIIKNTILRIASLMFMETSGNIGLSARTSPDNSKTFISYNNYSKYLAPLERYRVVRF